MARTARRALLPALLLAAAAAAPAQTPSRHPVEAFVLEALPGLSRMTVFDARKLGEVKEEKRRTLPSDWVDGEQVEIVTVVLDGAELSFAVHGGRRDFLVSATFTKATWKLQGGLAVGARKQAVVKAFGPGQEEGQVARYWGGDEAPQIAEFTIEAGIVTKIRVIPYTG